MSAGHQNTNGYDDLPPAIVAAIVAALQAVQQPVEPEPPRLWAQAAQIAPAWSDTARHGAWSAVDRERGWRR
jgi:hypothetical protein